MTLPDNGAPWPPPHMAPHYAEIARDDAWYSGDPRRLARHDHTAPRQEQERKRKWGRTAPPVPGRGRRLHVPLAGDIASTSADLLCADMPAITCEDTTTQDRLNVILDEGRVHSTLLAGAEYAAALSGVYLRTTWDRNLAPRPIPTVVQPDAAIPEWRWGVLTAVTFWRELPGSTTATVWRHLERHTVGHVEHGLYEGTPDNLGRSIPLTEHAETADLIASLDPDGDGRTVNTDIPLLTASYVPNIGTNRRHRGSPYGRSDYSSPLYDLFSGLDDTWTSWMRDIRLARARLIVPSGYLQDHGPGRGASFDDDQEIYAALNMPPNESGSGITAEQFDIRVEQHQGTAEAITRQAAQSAGYSAQSFGLDGGGQPITATESDSRDQRSMVTRKKKVGYTRPAVAEQMHVALMLDNAHFDGSNDISTRPRVDFGDGVAESEQATATVLDLLSRAGAVSTATKVKIRNPTWDDADIAAEAVAILRETGAAAPDPGSTYPM
ncbi:phage portal protein [Streptomyces sp. NPDC056500]|uniref:phage portal protein n=1 Tax=Streptomyces sp. NPDC056500 TaxID=3345840 RepID=UPI00368091C2